MIQALPKLVRKLRWSYYRALRALRQNATHGKRSLINEIMLLNLALLGIVGTLAIAGVFVAAQWFAQTNLTRWTLQWADELTDLGAPLYLPDARDVVLQVEDFVQRYPEIVQVTYYGVDGAVKLSIGREAGLPDSMPLATATAAELLARAASTEPYLVSTDSNNRQHVTIAGPIWTESLDADALFDLDPAVDSKSSIEALGFVQLDLDFSWQYQQILSNVWLAGVVLLVLLIIAGLVGRSVLKRALGSLADLQKPIAELASGNLDVYFESAAHREIGAIVGTLQNTTAALRERNARLVRLANHDTLTGLFNRHRFVDELIAEVEHVGHDKTNSALFFIDLDQFKYVNDTCGHPAGDQLLQMAAERLQNCVREEDVVARFGGDEFAILVRGVTRQRAQAVGNRILKDMRQTAHLNANSIFQLQCSIGVTMIKSDRFDAHELLAQADVACHAAKAGGRNRLEIYRVSAKETDQMAMDMGWNQRIRQALVDDGFLLHYQPIVEIKSGRVSHHEVLLRMASEDGSLVMPNMFLTAATRFGLMPEIDTWVVDHAIRALAEFREADPDMRFTINLSAHAFESKGLTSQVKSLLEEYGLPGDSVVFEITERVAVRHLTDVNNQIAALKELGCELAIDDFGAGYSSFSYLKRLPADYIKIDGEFIRDLATDEVDQTMVRLIGEVGAKAGMKTIAEYVENAEAMSILAELGIDYAQGFFIGHPAATPGRPAEPVSLEKWRRKRRAG